GPDGNLYVASLTNGAVYKIANNNLNPMLAGPPNAAQGVNEDNDDSPGKVAPAGKGQDREGRSPRGRDHATTAAPSRPVRMQSFLILPNSRSDSPALNGTAANDIGAVGDHMFAGHTDGMSGNAAPTLSLRGDVAGVAGKDMRAVGDMVS